MDASVFFTTFSFLIFSSFSFHPIIIPQHSLSLHPNIIIFIILHLFSHSLWVCMCVCMYVYFKTTESTSTLFHSWWERIRRRSSSSKQNFFHFSLQFLFFFSIFLFHFFPSFRWHCGNRKRINEWDEILHSNFITNFGRRKMSGKLIFLFFYGCVYSHSTWGFIFLFCVNPCLWLRIAVLTDLFKS